MRTALAILLSLMGFGLLYMAFKPIGSGEESNEENNEENETNPDGTPIETDGTGSGLEPAPTFDCANVHINIPAWSDNITGINNTFDGLISRKEWQDYRHTNRIPTVDMKTAYKKFIYGLDILGTRTAYGMVGDKVFFEWLDFYFSKPKYGREYSVDKGSLRCVPR